MKLAYIHSIPATSSEVLTPWDLGLQAHGWDTIAIPLARPEQLGSLGRDYGCTATQHPDDVAWTILSQFGPCTILLDNIATYSEQFLTRLRNLPCQIAGLASSQISSSHSLQLLDLVLSSSPDIRHSALARGARATLEFIVGAPLHETNASHYSGPSYDVVFCGDYGAGYTESNQLLLGLSKGILGWHGGYSVGIFFRGAFDLESMPVGVAMHAAKAPPRAQLRGLVTASRIALWLGSDTPSAVAFERELLELAVTGTPLLCRAGAGAERFFIPNQEIVTFSSGSDMVEKVRWLLDNPEKCAAIGNAARTRTYDKYNFDASVRALDTALRSYVART